MHLTTEAQNHHEDNEQENDRVSGKKGNMQQQQQKRFEELVKEVEGSKWDEIRPSETWRAA